MLTLWHSLPGEGLEDLPQIVGLSLAVSGGATVLAAVLGVLFAAWLAFTRFAGRRAVVVGLNALLGLPPVVVGLVLYLLLSRQGPLGALGL